MSNPEKLSAVESDGVKAQPRKERMLSLDVMRGLTLAFMIVVNTQGPSAFHPMQHAYWNGCTPTDLVFPTFLFLVGITTVFSSQARLSRGASRGELLRHAAVRCLVLIGLGFVVNNFPFFHLATARYYGVLPRIGLCYFAVAALYLWRRTWKDKVVIAVACLVGYWALMRFVPVPGYGVPTHDVPLLDRDGSLAASIDRQIFSAQHLYERVRDPEGLLSTLPAIATALMGLLTGMWLRTSRSMQDKAKGIAVAGVSCVLLGAAWNFTFPINKKLWTSSYVLFAGGWSLLLLAVAIWVVDIKRFGRKHEAGADQSSVYAPFLVFGTNAIAAYLLSELLDATLSIIKLSSGMSIKAASYAAVASAIPSAGVASLVFSLMMTLLCWLIVYPLYRNKLFLKI